MKYLELMSGTVDLNVSKLAIGTAGSMFGLAKAEIFKLFDLLSKQAETVSTQHGIILAARAKKMLETGC